MQKPPTNKETALLKELARTKQKNRDLKVQVQNLRKTQMSLVQYLSNINSAESQWGLWVNPQNLDEYRVGQYIFENGGMKDNWQHIGSLDSLSSDRLEYCGTLVDWLENRGRDTASIDFNGKQVFLNPKSMGYQISKGNVAEDFVEVLRAEFDEFCDEWSQEWAEIKVEELKNYFAPGGEWEKEQEQARLEQEAYVTYQRQLSSEKSLV